MKRSLKQVAVRCNATAEDAVALLLEQVTHVVPGIHTDVQTGAITLSSFTELSVTEAAQVRRELRGALRELADQGLDPAPATISIRQVPPKDWAESWKRHFKPVDIEGRLLLKPTWSRRQPRPGQALVLLDPGLSFGTGQHATTRFCLQELVRFRDPSADQTLLDMGTGSGILALAGVALGYDNVEGFDFDPDCVRTAGENAVLNGMASSVSFQQQDVTRLPARPSQRFSAVCANLMADLLISQSARISARVAKAGILILAGILDTQFPQVEAAYGALGWRRLRDCREGEWRSASFIKP